MFQEIVYNIANLIPPQIISFLCTPIINTSVVYLDYWSILHVIAGILFFKYVSKKFGTFFVVIIVAEILENLLGIHQTVKHPIFYEVPLDTFWDFVTSTAGFLLAAKMGVKHTQLKFFKHKKI